MLSFPAPSVYQTSKCFFTYGQMGHFDPKQLPEKGKPWSSILAQDFIHKVDLVLPDECYELLRERLLDNLVSPQFYRVTMPLRQVLDGTFFTEYIKLGNIVMLSQGNDTVDNVFTIQNGKLTMFLDKETYERAGLVGTPHGVKGKRGSKPRWIVEFDLKSPSMIHGKKGFDRLIYACKEALKSPITWLFCNLGTTPTIDPLAQHSPIKFTASQTVSQSLPVNMPALEGLSGDLAGSSKEGAAETVTELYEWLSLVRLGSPRIALGDDIDPYLSHYRVPECTGPSDPPPDPQLANIRRISWRGFISPSWARQLLADVAVQLPSNTWFSFSSTSFAKGVTGDNSECTVFRPPNSAGQYLLWQVKRDG